jgi:spore germination cell wall hydrolase CwlJ-like protein
MNSSHYPDTLRGVIFQSGQFPPATNGKLEQILESGVKDLCVTAAQDALSGKNNIGDCLQFRSKNSGHVGTVIGNNVFF